MDGFINSYDNFLGKQQGMYRKDNISILQVPSLDHKK